MNNIVYGGTAPINGAGETIAIIEAFDDPRIETDVTTFDNTFGTAANGLAARPTGAFLSVVNQNGVILHQPNSPAPPVQDSTGVAEEQESLDVEWAHAVAPGANIILVECNSTSPYDLMGTQQQPGGVYWARQQPGVSVISMSFSISESQLFAATGGPRNPDAIFDPDFTTPAGHTGITFVASAGNNGSVFSNPGGPTNIGTGEYPAVSPNVLSVGGTSLNLNSNGTYQSEGVWNNGTVNGSLQATGGGPSIFEGVPSYQNTTAVNQAVTAQGLTPGVRITPDVAFDGDPNTGVPIVDSFVEPGLGNSATNDWTVAAGTALGAQAWAGIVAIADQALAFNGQGSFDGPTQLLPALYNPNLSASVFHDITPNISPSSNGTYSSATGYDLVTGLGTPNVTAFVGNMAPFDIVKQVTSGSTTLGLGSAGEVYIMNSNGTDTPTGLSGACDIAGGASGLIALGNNGDVYLFNSSTGQFNTQSPIVNSKNVTAIAEGTDQNGAVRLFVLLTNGDVYQYYNGTFETPASINTKNITGLASGMNQAGQIQAFVLTNTGIVYHYLGSTGAADNWSTSVSGGVSQIASGSGQFFVLTTSGAVWHYRTTVGSVDNYGPEASVSGGVADIASGSGKFFVLLDNGVVYQYQTTDGTVDNYGNPSVSGGVTGIASGQNQFIIVQSNGAVYQYSPGNGYVPQYQMTGSYGVPITGVQIATGSDQAFVLNTSGAVFQFNQQVGPTTLVSGEFATASGVSGNVTDLESGEDRAFDFSSGAVSVYSLQSNQFVTASANNTALTSGVAKQLGAGGGQAFVLVGGVVDEFNVGSAQFSTYYASSTVQSIAEGDGNFYYLTNGTVYEYGFAGAVASGVSGIGSGQGQFFVFANGVVQQYIGQSPTGVSTPSGVTITSISSDLGQFLATTNNNQTYEYDIATDSFVLV
jgi:subtilase family serine protease